MPDTLAEQIEALLPHAEPRDLMMYGEPEVGLRTEPFFGEPLKGDMRPLADWQGYNAELVVVLWNNRNAIVAALKRVDALEAAAAKARDTFQRYGDLHKAKGTKDGEQKAAVNWALALEMDEALTGGTDA